MPAVQLVQAEATDLIVVEKLTPMAVFAPGGVQDILDKITREVRSTQTDISTKAGREAVASLAYKVARSKTALDEMGKTLVAEWKTKTSAVDAERRTIREKLDELKDEVRKPLTDWEDAEKKRVADHEQTIALIEEMARFDATPSIADVTARLDAFLTLPVRDWEEFAKRGQAAEAATTAALERVHAETIKREAEATELARLRAEQIAREQKERDDRIAAAAAERAKQEAEAKAAAEAAAAEERTRAEIKKAEDARHAAMLESVRAENERREAQLRADAAEATRIEQAAQAEREKKEAAAAAERNRLASIEAERKRVANEAARVAAETAKREANQKHLAKINNDVLAAFVGKGVDPEAGKVLITAIARGEIPHTKISY
jgi:hypothetical protein